MSQSVMLRLPLVGRKEECQIIAQEISSRQTRIAFIEGVAGIGKTVLLEETERLAQESGAHCLPIIDFYDTEMHAHPAIERAIAESLDPERAVFSGYWNAQDQMKQSLSGRTLKEQQEELWKLFLEAYTTFAEKEHIVLRFDTAERLEYERDSDSVMTDCQVQPEDAPSWEWLIKRITKLKNTTVIIASRPTPDQLLKKRLLKTHSQRVRVIELQGFTLEETNAYFRMSDFGKQVAHANPEMLSKVHILTDGRPILTALALDWLERGMWDPELYPAKLQALTELKADALVEEYASRHGKKWLRWNEVKHTFEVSLVQQIRGLNHTGLDAAVLHVAVARKGCNADLLARLMQIPIAQAQSLVEQLLALSFVKPPRGPRHLFFLHDEMYNLVEEYIWKADWPDYSEQIRLDEIVIQWYAGQIEDLARRINACRTWQEQNALRRQQQLLQVEQLYYQFDADPRIGYQEYSRLDEQAIGAKEHEWDIWLRNEALGFTSHRAWRHGRGPSEGRSQIYPVADPATDKHSVGVRSAAVDHDCRRRWVSRYISRNETSKAARVGERLLKRVPLAGEPELYRGGIQIALATAQAYMGGEFSESALRNFEQGIDSLESTAVEHREPWLFPYLLARAYLSQGLALRNSLRLRRAAMAYGQSVRSYRSIDYQPGLAEALNNLAYIYARQGQLEQAMVSCDDSLRIRRELGDEYSIGLSLNTKGIIFERKNQPLKAILNSEEALRIFNECGDERGVIFAEINLGRSYRRKARDAEWGQKDSDFEIGLNYLVDAIKRERKLGRNFDKFYRIESHNELGSLYRDWVATLAEKKLSDDRRLLGYLDQAESQLLKSIDLCMTKERVIPLHAVQYVDSLEDLARVYYWRARLGLRVGKAAAHLGIKQPLKAMKFLLDDAKRYAEKHLGELEELSFILGKIYYQYARFARERAGIEPIQSKHQALLDNVASDYARAAAYLESYSFDAPELVKTVSDASSWLCTFQAGEATRWVSLMYRTLKSGKRESRRLQEWIDRVVYPLLGVDWPGKGKAHG